LSVDDNPYAYGLSAANDSALKSVANKNSVNFFMCLWYLIKLACLYAHICGRTTLGRKDTNNIPNMQEYSEFFKKNRLFYQELYQIDKAKGY
jgi:hypothetical protein